MLNTPLPRLLTDSIGGLSSPTVNWSHTRLRLPNLVFCGANACSDRKVMQLAGFLYHLFNTKPVRAQIIASATGTKVRHTAPERIYSVNVSIPSSVDDQRWIGEIISTYDDIIDNNRRRIRLLEQIVRLLYDEWFVHLRFPGYERVTIAGGVPHGWHRKPLSTMCKDIRLSVDPKLLSYTTPYIGIEHIPRRSITLSDWDSSADVVSTKFMFSEGDILFGKIRPYFHKVGFSLTSVCQKTPIPARNLRRTATPSARFRPRNPPHKHH